MDKLHIDSYQLAKRILNELSEKSGVSGYEHFLQPDLNDLFTSFETTLSSDCLGNCYFEKKGFNSKQSIMLAAHSDEIGLMVTHIDQRGFLHFTAVGGIDGRTLIHQEVIVHGLKDVNGIICFIPSQDNMDAERKRAIDPINMVIDIGYGQERANEIVKPGDIVSIVRKPLNLLNEITSGKALDDRAGITVLAICLNELNRIKHRHNVIAVATVQEEIGLRGALTSSQRLNPSIAIAVDVTHAQTLDSKSQVNTYLGKGPVITLGPNIYPDIFSRLVSSAKEHRLPYQLQPVPGPTGTDARVIQLVGYGIPTGLVSIPLRYMHTSLETASLSDIVDCGRLLACFIASLPEDLEELTCY